MSVLVSGGAGFIGSHTVVVLCEAGVDVVVVDNFYNSNPSVLDKLETITGKKVTFYEGDVTDSSFLDSVFKKHHFEAIIHFAGYKAVGESVLKPLKYYRNNLNSTLALTEKALEYHVPKFIFSSSATVYGDRPAPLKEEMACGKTTNPYGETKSMSERILEDTAAVNPEFSVALLRYFNPIGAHKSGLIGEIPVGTPNNLMPYIAQVAKGKRERLSVYGNDYPTVDGTGVRDYIHVMDLAYGHKAALDFMPKGIQVYNLGSGQGTSVLELITTFERVNGIKIPYIITDRRPGDVATSYADVSKSNLDLKWKTQKSVEDMCRDAWNFERNLQD